MASLSFCSINVRGLATKSKRKRIFEFYKQSKHSIIALQETHQSNENFKKWKKEWGGGSIWNPCGNRSSGTALLFKKYLNVNILNHDTDYEGRVLRVSLEIDSLPFQIIVVYGYNPSDEEESENFFDYLKSYAVENFPCILLGDFNMVQNLEDDRAGGRPRPLHTFGKQNLEEFLSLHNLGDAWRYIYPDRHGFTWRSEFYGIKSRLDRIYIPFEWMEGVKSLRVSPFSWSDHDEISIRITLPCPFSRGPGYWRFNNSLLENEDFTNHITRFFEQWQNETENYDDLGQWWDMAKYHFKRIAVHHSIKIAKQRKNEREDLLTQLEQEENEYHVDKNKVREIREQIKQLDFKSAEKVFLTTHIKYLEEDEKPTKYFFALQKAQSMKKSIVKLKKLDENKTLTLITEQDEIRKEASNFYENLYTKQKDLDENVQAALINNIKRKIPDAKKASLEKKLSKVEIKTALFQSKSGKMPGWCGLTYEFYKFFWNTLEESFFKMQDQALNTIHKLSETQRKSIITLLYKGDDEEDIRNWRPVALLCTDYKIIAKALSNRLKQVLGFCIHEDQTCGIPKRTIVSNLHLTRDVIRYTNQKKLKSYIISVDQEKAFDTVDREFLFEILEKMNFGPNFIKWIKTLYRDSEACVLLNGYLSCLFRTTRGIKQGDPTSSELYDVWADVLSEWVRSDKRIKGIRLPGHQITVVLSAYADDSNYFIRNLKSLYALFEAFQFFERGTGARIKPNKTKGLCLGGARPFFEISISIQWCNKTGMKSLGVIFFTNEQRTARQNWNDRIEKLENFTETNKNRKLSLRGRAMNLNMAGLSKMWYLATTYPAPDNLKTKLESIIFSYLWKDSYTHRKEENEGQETKQTNQPLNKNTTYLPLHQGGLGLINPFIQSTAMRTAYFSHVVDATEKGKWTYLARYWVGFPIAKVCPEWAFLSVNNFGNICDRTDYPNYYKDCLDHISSTDPDKITWVTADIRKQIQSKAYVEPKAQGLWEKEGKVGVDWKKAWSGIYFSHASPFQKEIHFKFLHQILYTNLYLSKFRGHKIKPHCKFCKDNGKETIEDTFHIFFKCDRGHFMWQEIMPIFNIFFPTTRLRRINFFMSQFPAGTSDETKQIVMAIMQITLQKIWLNRNKYNHEKHLVDFKSAKRDILAGIINMVTAKYNVFFRAHKIDTFRKKFLSWPNFCKFENSKLHFPIISDLLNN